MSVDFLFMTAGNVSIDFLALFTFGLVLLGASEFISFFDMQVE
jgi:hypothetical protein